MRGIISHEIGWHVAGRANLVKATPLDEVVIVGRPLSHKMRATLVLRMGKLMGANVGPCRAFQNSRLKILPNETEAGEGALPTSPEDAAVGTDEEVPHSPPGTSVGLEVATPCPKPCRVLVARCVLNLKVLKRLLGFHSRRVSCLNSPLPRALPC